jgi:hypothetical protein
LHGDFANVNRGAMADTLCQTRCDIRLAKWWTERRNPAASTLGLLAGIRAGESAASPSHTSEQFLAQWFACPRGLARGPRSRLCIATTAMRSPSVAGAAQVDLKR